MFIHDFLKKIYLQFFPYKTGRKNSQPLDHYIDVFLYVLKTGISWRDLKYQLHYTTYQKKFKIWSNLGIFSLLHSELLKYAISKSIIDKKDLKTLLIDSTIIKNYKGVDCTGKNHYDRNRKGSKLTLITTKNGFPLSICATSANRHDQTQVSSVITKSTINLSGSTLIADCGYNSNPLKDNLKKQFNISLIYPYKINQSVKNTKTELKLLSERYKIENTFAHLQNFKRLRARDEKYINTFCQFYYLGLSVMIIRKINKK